MDTLRSLHLTTLSVIRDVLPSLTAWYSNDLLGVHCGPRTVRETEWFNLSYWINSSGIARPVRVESPWKIAVDHSQTSKIFS